MKVVAIKHDPSPSPRLIRRDRQMHHFLARSAMMSLTRVSTRVNAIPLPGFARASMGHVVIYAMMLLLAMVCATSTSTVHFMITMAAIAAGRPVKAPRVMSRWWIHNWIIARAPQREASRIVSILTWLMSQWSLMPFQSVPQLTCSVFLVVVVPIAWKAMTMKSGTTGRVQSVPSFPTDWMKRFKWETVPTAK